MDVLTDSEARLVDAMAASGRGPKQNGLFALWLVVRLCDGFLPPDPSKPSGQRKRIHNVERRLSSLSLPAPLRRALVAAIRELEHGGARSVDVALHQLVAPARETVGGAAAEALAQARRAARTAMQETPAVSV